MPRSVTHRPATQRFMVKPYLPVLLAVLLGTLAAAGAHAAPAGESPVRFLTGPQAGEPVDLALGYLNANREAFGLSASDLADMVIVDHYRTRHNGVTHVYLRQRLDGVEVWNGDININVARDGSIINLGNRFVSDLAGRAVSRSPGIDAETAVQRAATHLGLVARSSLTVLETAGGPSLAVTFDGTGISHRPIPVKLVYERTDAGPRLAWDVVIDPVDSPNWWDMRVDAETGEVLGKVNWTDSESHGVAHHGVAHHGEAHHGEARGGIPQDSYNVLPLPLESPYDGAHSLHTGPADPTASPFGWHDTDGDIDPDFTDTRGNNVEASEDTDGNNIPGFRPSGGSGPVLTFNYAWNAGDQPDGGTNQEAAIVNLFYMNNVMHDLTYQYGFDEPSGNFQFNTYGRGGTGGDPVQADAQDGSGTNNATFGTPSDGADPRMTMFIYLPPPELVVNTPASIAGSYPAGGASFGATIDAVGFTGNVTYVDDGDATAGSIHDACETITAGALTGVVALIDRGGCEFGVKVLNAENAGAIAAIVVNNAGDGVQGMAPGAVGGQVTIPSVFIGQGNGDLIKAELPTPGVNITMRSSNPIRRDSDLDNGIINHEYGHGVSNRLTGGRFNTGCLDDDEQAGEGWSDFWSLMLSAEAGDQRDEARGIGNYATFRDPTAGGIRNFPYSTDMAVNPQVYSDIGGTNIPHGVGEIWMAMVWEMYWNLVDKHGFDPDFYFGTGGNNLTIQLVIDGMKLQPCEPTFVEARDAILLADQTNNGGANQCEIWRGFAKRGLGLNAATLSSGVGDETDDFDVPAACAVDIFTDGFESGDLLAWSNSVVD